MEQDEKIVGKKIKAVPKTNPEIGIDTNSTLVTDMLDAAEVSQLDISSLENFSSVAQTRENIYSLIDMMSEDDRVASVLETYAEDVVETNESGQVIWCEASNPEVNKYVTYLLDSLNVDKNAYEWVYSLIKYGDIYLKTYRESDYGKDMLFGKEAEEQSNTLNESLEDSIKTKYELKDSLKEDVNLQIHKKNDRYVHYVEMEPNPAEMFELTKFGKTMGYIKAPTRVQNLYNQTNPANTYLTYKIKKDDITVFDALSYVHASLKNDNSARNPEEVSIFLNDDDYENNENSITYRVKKGQSILYNLFSIWRALSLLENSVLLNRLTKSSIVRVLNVDVGDMGKEQVNNFISKLKSKIEQKSAINVNNSMQEYTNPGPIENILYIPTHGTQGQITAQSIGGDVDPKQLTDIEYFLNKFYGALRAPKQYFAQTDDSAGFNGGSSLSIISSRYGKVIKRIQNTMCQLITDLINLFLIDKGLVNYINQFTIRMQAPVTQEEIDRREDMRNRMGVINDIMNQLGNVITDEVLKLKITKSLLATTVTSPEVIEYIQDQIDMIEEEREKKSKIPDKEDNKKEKPRPEEIDDMNLVGSGSMPIPTREETPEETVEEPIEQAEEPGEESNEDSYLPSPDELNLDLTTNI